MQRAQDEFTRRGIAIVVVSFAPAERLVLYQQKHQWPFPIFGDPERAAYAHFGLERLPWRRVFSPSTIKFYTGALLKGGKLHNYGRDDYRQSGGDFVVDRTGKILFAHRSHDPADRPTVRQLLAAVSERSA